MHRATLLRTPRVDTSERGGVSDSFFSVKRWARRRGAVAALPRRSGRRRIFSGWPISPKTGLDRFFFYTSRMLTAPRHSSSVGRRFGDDPLSPALASGGTFFERTLLAAPPTTYTSLAMTLMSPRGGQHLVLLFLVRVTAWRLYEREGRRGNPGRCGIRRGRGHAAGAPRRGVVRVAPRGEHRYRLAQVRSGTCRGAAATAPHRRLRRFTEKNESETPPLAVLSTRGVRSRVARGDNDETWRRRDVTARGVFSAAVVRPDPCWGPS